MATDVATRTPAEAREEFRQLASEFRTRSTHMSNPAQYATLDSYLYIVGMGPAAVPLILEELRREPYPWFWALKAITKQDPVPPEERGHVAKMAAAWLRWGVRQGLIPE